MRVVPIAKHMLHTTSRCELVFQHGTKSHPAINSLLSWSKQDIDAEVNRHSAVNLLVNLP